VAGACVPRERFFHFFEKFEYFRGPTGRALVSTPTQPLNGLDSHPLVLLLPFSYDWSLHDSAKTGQTPLTSTYMEKSHRRALTLAKSCVVTAQRDRASGTFHHLHKKSFSFPSPSFLHASDHPIPAKPRPGTCRMLTPLYREFWLRNSLLFPVARMLMKGAPRGSA
jgi:hypothetical protein